jgi:hypothetical protein
MEWSKKTQTKELSNKQPLNIGGVSISLFNSLEMSINEYVKLFCKKHELSFDFWIANITGTIASFSNTYYINFEDVRVDLEKNADKNHFIDWYDSSLDAHHENKDFPNYSNYLKGVGCN